MSNRAVKTFRTAASGCGGELSLIGRSKCAVTVRRLNSVGNPTEFLGALRGEDVHELLHSLARRLGYEVWLATGRRRS